MKLSSFNQVHYMRQKFSKCMEQYNNTSPKYSHINELMQERCNSSASAMELRLSCINPSTWCYVVYYDSTCEKNMVYLQTLKSDLHSTFIFIVSILYTTKGCVHCTLDRGTTWHYERWCSIFSSLLFIVWTYQPGHAANELNMQNNNQADIDVLMQERRISSDNALELLQSCTIPSNYTCQYSTIATFYSHFQKPIRQLLQPLITNMLLVTNTTRLWTFMNS